MLTLMMTMMSILDLPIQGNLLRSIVNWSGVARTVVQLETKKPQYLQTILAMNGVHSENMFWKKQIIIWRL